MEVTTKQKQWHSSLLDPSGRRQSKPRDKGKTMVIDKGLGLHAYQDLLETSGEHVDIIKLGFGTSVLYPEAVIKQKIALAKKHDIRILPGGTLLEIAITLNKTAEYFDRVEDLGFTAIEVSDGTIEMDRKLRNRLIIQGLNCGLEVYTEYGKKILGSTMEINKLLETVNSDLALGAEFVTMEARESGKNVGLFNENGDCNEADFQAIVRNLPNLDRIMWEAPLKSQQIYFLQSMGSGTNLGNISPEDIISLEALRRGLRSDMIYFGQQIDFNI